ncbi:patatin-like phospholipase family protein [Dokdonella immobilis]|uniref:Patatin-like phospholipase n=1 Tax=Dokdonella immobilis TaxID=578942 RepID=A0A1I4YGP3_9GAMM|nr:patatin-like phospholipase family protein [Dokdonella immobilis]SFN36983.1 Patatin-like phospholipase [Dokdonella immobilis]
MSETSANAVDYAATFDEVHAAEREWLARRRQAAGMPPVHDDAVGVAFSGGGIRSATFNLGVLQALEAGGLLPRVDYLSSVSGGGYVASCYSWLRSRVAPVPPGGVFTVAVPDSGGSVLDWLRGHGKYLVSQRGFSIWTLIASILASTFVNVLVLGPPLLAAVYALTLDWLPLAWPAWLSLPGGHVPSGNHGFLLLLLAGAFSLAAFPLVAIAFAFVSGVPRLARIDRIDRLRVLMGSMIIAGIALIAVGLIPIAETLGEMVEHLFATRYAEAIGHHMAYLTPILGGIASMLLDRRKGDNNGGRLTTIGLSLVVYGLLVLANHLAVHEAWLPSPLFFGFLALSVVLAVVSSLNRVSIHAYYRARLSGAFLPNVDAGPVIEPGEFRLDQLGPGHGAPLHLINTTLNTTSSDNEKLRSREGTSFFFSPVYTGSTTTGFRRIDRYAGGAMALSNAFTISGAAIDPDMVATRARSVSFLMALLNVRLGYWATNPKFGDRRPPPLPWWWIFITREMLGIGLDEKRHHVHLSDGGGFENLGIYELIRRRVRFLIVTDAGADPSTTLGDLGRAIERVRVDFGADIDIDADRLYRQRDMALMQQPYALGTIRYADGSAGRILYIKPTLCAGLTADIYAYWRANPAFPDEPTSEQFFAEPQFEAYRALGQQIVGKLIGATPPPGVAEWFEAIAEMQAKS